MAIKFNTYTELGEAVRKRNPKAFEGRNSESIGIDFSEKFGSKLNLRVEEEEDRASFKFDPEETGVGENVLKSLGNIPYSEKEDVKDLATDLSDPIGTVGTIARGAAGGIEHLLGTDISPENKRLASQLGEGITEAAGFEMIDGERVFTGRELVERPTSILGLLAGGTGAAAKGVSTAGKLATGARIAPRLTKAGRKAADAKAATRMASRVEKRPGLASAGEKLQRSAEPFIKGSQAFDPMNITARAGLTATGGAAKLAGKAAVGTGKLALGGAKAVGDKIVVKPLKSRFEGSSAQQLTNDAVEAVKGFAEQAAPGFQNRFNALFNKAKEGVETFNALERLTEFQKKAEGKATEAMADISDKQAGKVTTKGVLDGLIAQWMGFTTGLGPSIINKVMDISRLSDKGTEGATARQIMLEAANRDYKPTGKYQSIGEEIVDELADSLVKYERKMKTGTEEFRNKLKMGEVRSNSDDLKRSILSDEDFANTGIIFEDTQVTKTATVEPGVSIKPYDPQAQPSADIGPSRGAYSSGRLPGDVETRTMAGDPIPPVSYTTENLRPNVNLDRSDISKLGENSQRVKMAFDKAFDLGPNASVADLDKLKRYLQNEIFETTGTARATVQKLKNKVYKEIEDSYSRPENLEKLGMDQLDPGRANPYVEAMSAYEAYENRMDSIAKTLKTKDGQIKFEGTPLQVIRQAGNPTEVLKAVINSFDDGAGEMGMQNLELLLSETGNTTLIPKITGFAMRPVFGGGLVVRSEISQLGRGVVGFNLLNTLMAPVALASFSPKFGGMLLGWLYTPGNVQTLTRGGLNKIENVKKLTAEMLNKKIKDVTPADVEKFREVGLEVSEKIPVDEKQVSALRNLVGGGSRAVSDYVGRTRVTRPRTAARVGRLAVTAEEQGEEAQERRNLLSTLGQTQR